MTHMLKRVFCELTFLFLEFSKSRKKPTKVSKNKVSFWKQQKATYLFVVVVMNLN